MGGWLRRLATLPLRKPAWVQEEARFCAVDFNVVGRNRSGYRSRMCSAIWVEFTGSPCEDWRTSGVDSRSSVSLAQAARNARVAFPDCSCDQKNRRRRKTLDFGSRAKSSTKYFAVFRRVERVDLPRAFFSMIADRYELDGASAGTSSSSKLNSSSIMVRLVWTVLRPERKPRLSEGFLTPGNGRHSIVCFANFTDQR